MNAWRKTLTGSLVHVACDANARFPMGGIPSKLPVILLLPTDTFSPL